VGPADLFSTADGRISVPKIEIYRRYRRTCRKSNNELMFLICLYHAVGKGKIQCTQVNRHTGYTRFADAVFSKKRVRNLNKVRTLIKCHIIFWILVFVTTVFTNSKTSIFMTSKES